MSHFLNKVDALQMKNAMGFEYLTFDFQKHLKTGNFEGW